MTTTTTDTEENPLSESNFEFLCRHRFESIDVCVYNYCSSLIVFYGGLAVTHRFQLGAPKGNWYWRWQEVQQVMPRLTRRVKRKAHIYHMTELLTMDNDL